MARIRTVKPDFFRHEKLQDLEAANPGKYIMLVYIGLWTQADVNGVFPWKPRMLKLDILPFLEYDIEHTLQLLEQAGFIVRFSAQDADYAHIPSFRDHQRFGGKEAQEKGRYPIPHVRVKQQGSNGEATGKPEGMQERNREYKERNKEEGVNAPAHEEKIFSTSLEVIDEVTAYLRNDNWTFIAQMCDEAGYQPDQMGPARDEVKKFCIKYAEQMTRDPVHYFREKFLQWLINAKQFNKPRNGNARPYSTGQSPGQRSGAQTITQILGKS